MYMIQIIIAAAAVLPALLCAKAPQQLREQGTQEFDDGSTLTFNDFPDQGLKIHTFSSTEDTFFVTSQIIESENSIVIVDGQQLNSRAAEVRAIADGLNKTIEKVFLSHSHPDHWTGMESAFGDIEIVALNETIQSLAATGEFVLQSIQQSFGAENVTSSVIVPEPVLPGEMIIDNITYVLTKICDAEDVEQLIIALPQAGAWILQDFVFNNIHAFTGANQFDNWIGTLELLMSAASTYPVSFVGHGLPSDTKDLFSAQIDYLAQAKMVFEEVGADGYAAEMVSAFPDLQGEGVTELSASFLQNF